MDDEPDRLSNRLLEYDPESNKWTELGPMKFSKYRCSAVALNGEIYVLGETNRPDLSNDDENTTAQHTFVFSDSEYCCATTTCYLVFMISCHCAWL